MSKIFPKKYTTNKYYKLDCGCEVFVEVDKEETGEIFLTPTVKYCRVHYLGVDIVGAVKEYDARAK